MEVKLSKELNTAIEELQKKIKQVTGKHRSKRYLLQNLVDTGIQWRNNDNLSMCFQDIFEVETEVDSVVCSIIFPQETANEIDRITDEENTIVDFEATSPPDLVTKMQVINALALAAIMIYSAPYDEILDREKVAP